MKSKRHEVTLVIRADRQCTKGEAVAMVKDLIHGSYYPCGYGTSSSVEKFNIVTAKARPSTQEKR